MSVCEALLPTATFYLATCIVATD